MICAGKVGWFAFLKYNRKCIDKMYIHNYIIVWISNGMPEKAGAIM